MKTATATLTIDGQTVPINGERNVLDLARQAGIDIPTFCYHSSLSVYGACRMCLVEIEGKGVQTSCTAAPEPGMVVRTNTAEIREMRKIALELLLANHEQSCPSCPKAANCRLQELSHRLGVREVRFRRTREKKPVDASSVSLLRDPNKCILCGDCVRACRELQSIGAIDFAGRGSDVEVLPAFNRPLSEVECVNCGQCAAVCPTGALTPRNDADSVWAALEDPAKTVVVQVAPAVRVALGEQFGEKAGSIATGRMVAALKRLGFDQVYDTCFTADLTVLEEAEEFIARKTKGEKLPLFTSCCPGWVSFVEQYFPDLLGNLSSCRSPQQMFGAVARKLLPTLLDVEPENLVVVSIMPCTAKKAEAKRPEFSRDGQPDVDHVVTTQELAHMIGTAGLSFSSLEPESFDLPMGFKTGAGIIFGTTGGVTEAVLRYAVEKVNGVRLTHVDFQEVRGEQGVREATIELAGNPVKLAVVHGLANARQVAERVVKGEADYDLIEVMACPGGCIGGAGQPVTHKPDDRRERAKSLYDVDKMLQLHKSQDNPKLHELYAEHLGEIGGPMAHQLLHTGYTSKRRMFGSELSLTGQAADDALPVSVCVGTNCHVKNGQNLLRSIMNWVDEQDLAGRVDISATFCLERCGEGPNVAVAGEIISRATLEAVTAAINAKLTPDT